MHAGRLVSGDQTGEPSGHIAGPHLPGGSRDPRLPREPRAQADSQGVGDLSREQVDALAERRAAERAARPARSPRKYQRVDHRPVQDHEWLAPRQVAELLGVTRPAVQGRIHRGTLPATENGGRYWVRRDLLEQGEAARFVRKTRRPWTSAHADQR